MKNSNLNQKVGCFKNFSLYIKTSETTYYETNREKELPNQQRSTNWESKKQAKIIIRWRKKYKDRVWKQYISSYYVWSTNQKLKAYQKHYCQVKKSQFSD